MQGRRTRLRIILNKSSGPIPQTKSRALADASGKKIPGLVAGRRDYFGKRGSGLCIWQQPRQPLTRDDAAVKVAGRMPSVSAPISTISLQTDARSSTGFNSLASHRYHAISHTVARIDHKV